MGEGRRLWGISWWDAREKEREEVGGAKMRQVRKDSDKRIR
jgi:hypothetical protein